MNINKIGFDDSDNFEPEESNISFKSNNIR